MHDSKIDRRLRRIMGDELASWFGPHASVTLRHESRRGRPFLRTKMTLQTSPGNYDSLRAEFDSYITEGAMRDCQVYIDGAEPWNGLLKATVVAAIDSPLFADSPLMRGAA